MPHPWSSLAQTLFVRAFSDARELHIPPEVMCGAAMRCAAEVTRLMGVSEAQFINLSHEAFKAAGGATPGKGSTL